MKPSGFSLIAVLAATLLVSLDLQADPLATARGLESNRFNGWTYGTKASDMQIDCVQFILAVVEEELKQSLGTDIRTAILINHGWTKEETQTLAEAGTDKRLAGIQYGLTEVSTLGEKVAPSDARPGDLIQYWMKKSDGSWFGHSGVIVSVANGRAKILSASASANKITDTTDPINLNGSNRLIYLVRLKPM